MPVSRWPASTSLPAYGSGAHEKTVCNCHKVSDAAIQQAVSEGARSVDAVGLATRAGTGCGSHRTEIARLVQLVPSGPSEAVAAASHAS